MGRRQPPPPKPRAATPEPKSRRAGELLRWGPLVLLVLAGLYFPLARALRPTFEPVAPPDWGLVDPLVRPLLQRTYDEALAEPGSGAAHGRLAMVYEANGFWEEAWRSYDQALRIEPDEVGWRLHRGLALAELGRWEEALPDMELAAEAPAFRAPAEHRRGWLLLDAGRIEEARSAFRLARAAAPERVEPRVGLAAALLRGERQAEEARGLLEESLALEPASAQAHFLLGTALGELGRTEEARRELALGAGAEPALLPDPLTPQLNAFRQDSATRIDQAYAMIRAGKAEDGLRVLEQVYGETPNDSDAINNLAVAMIESGQAERALAQLERARELRPGAFQTWLNMGACLIALGRLEEALGCAERAVELAPDLGAPQLLRGKILAHTGRLAEARPYLERAVLLDAGNPDAHFLLGEVLAVGGQYQAAHEQLSEAVRLRPGHLLSQLKLCQLASALGRTAEAQQALEAARRIAPDSPEVARVAQSLGGGGGR